MSARSPSVSSQQRLLTPKGRSTVLPPAARSSSVASNQHSHQITGVAAVPVTTTHGSPVLRFNDRHTADFTVVSENQEIYVHKSIMMSQSPFLRRFLSDDPTCTRINANNAKFAAMKAVLGALYIIPLDLSSYTPELRTSIVQHALKLHEGASHTTPSPSRTASVSVTQDAAAMTWETHASNFDFVLSAWEISLHFQIAPVAHYVMNQLLLPLLDRRNVVRCLKGALKHQHTSPDALAVMEWCTDNKLLPPELDSPESIATWETLCNKYPYLRDVSNTQQIGLDDVANMSSAVSPPSAERERSLQNRNAAAFEDLVHDGTPRQLHQEMTHSLHHPHPALLANVYRQSPSSNTPYVTVLHSRSVSAEDVTNPRNYFQPMHASTTSAIQHGDDVPSLYHHTVAATTHPSPSRKLSLPAGVAVDGRQSRPATPQSVYHGLEEREGSSISPQRQQMIYLSDRAQRHIQEETAAQEQAAANEALVERLAQERELLRIEEAEFQQVSAQWKRDIAHLTTLLQDLEKEDLDVVEAQQALNKVDIEVADAERQLAELRMSRTEAQEALQENEDYMTSTAGYLPAAAAAERELSAKLDEVTMWVSNKVPVGSTLPGNSATGALLRQLLAEYAATLRKEKDEALRSLESEARIEDALRQHIHTERSSAMHLQSMLDAHAANLTER